MYATIQMRHGNEADMDKSKFVPAEMGVATDTKKAFMAFAPGEVKEIMFREDSEIEELLEEVRDISDQAVEAVESAEATAKQAIEDYTDQMKATIPEDYTEMVKKVDMLERTKAPAIYQTVSGESLQIEDSADAPMAGLRVFGKSRQVKTTGAQLMDLRNGKSGTGGGVTYTNRGDGSYTRVGTSTNDAGNVWFAGDYNKDPENDENVLFTLSPGTYYFKHIVVFSGVNPYPKNLNNEGAYTLESEFKVTGIRNPLQPIGTTYNDIIYPMLNRGSSALPWEPYTGGKPSPSSDYTQEIEIPGSKGSVGVNVTGAQLFDASNLATKTQGNVTITNNGDGSFNISGNGNVPGTNYPSIMLSKEESLKLIKPGTLRLAENSDIRPRFMAGLRNTQTNTFRKTVGNQLRLSIEITEDDIQKIESGQDVFSYCFFDNADVQIVPGTIKPMVYIGGIPQMPWEPYKHQSITLSTPNGLPGIPVDSGGNYTDSDGQQWICDEVDFDRGKYVQRVKKVVYDGSEEEGWLMAGTASEKYRVGNYNMQNSVLGSESNSTKAICMCSNYQIVTANNTYTNIEGFSVDPNGLIFIYDKNYNTQNSINDYKNYLSEHPMTVIYALATPIETDLSAEELTAYAALRTNYPTTVVTSDSDPITVGIEVEYVADTKTFVENKINELKQLLAGTQSLLVDLT